VPEQSPTPATGLRFDLGGQQAVALATADALGLVGSDFTLEAWIKPQGLRNDTDFPIAGAALAGSQSGLQLLIRNGRLLAALNDSALVGNTPLQSDVWCHIALRYDAATTEQVLLVNGVVDAQARSAALAAGGTPLSIGRAGANFFEGMITEVRLWHGTRTDAQIGANLYRRLNGQEQSLSGYWPLNEGTGLLARDRRQPINAVDGQPLPIVARDGTIAADTWSRLDDLPLRVLPPGIEAADVLVAELSGADAGLEVPNQPALTITNSITAEAWVRAKGTGRTVDLYPILSMYSGNKGWELRCGNGESSFIAAVNTTPTEVTSRDLVANTWVHIAAAYDGQHITLYVNGVRKSIQPLSGSIIPYPGALGIGCNTYWRDRGFAGQLAEVRLWNVARTQLEIQQGLFNRLVGDEPGLIAVWSLEGDPSASKDELGAAPHGGVAWTYGGVPLPLTPTAESDTSTKPTGLRAQLTAARRRNATLVEQNKDLAEARRLLEEQFTRQLEQLLKDRAELKRQLDELSQQVKRVENANTEFSKNNAKLRSEKDELVRGGGARTTLQDFVQNANDSIKRARAELRREGSSYSLERVSLEVKMLPGPAGEGLFFPQQEDLVGGEGGAGGLDPDHLSMLSLEFAANEPADKPQIPPLTVPSVVGYTEIMARRKLSEAGFQVTRDFQAVIQRANEPIQADRVVDQLPRAGEKWPPGGAVTVFIGRETMTGS
jgi:cell division septum initiation protein DivIVA